jgi:hypothetical protein
MNKINSHSITQPAPIRRSGFLNPPITALCLCLATFLLSSCGSKKESAVSPPQADQKSVMKETEEAHDDHGAEAEGATYQEGKGITLMEETKKSLGLELLEVAESELQPTALLQAQIYRAASEPSRIHGRERQGQAYASALISRELADQLKLGQSLTFKMKSDTNTPHQGTVWKMDSTQLAMLNKVEALLELPDSDQKFGIGDHVEATLPLGKAPKTTLSIPHSALLETSMGTYAFVQNGTFLLRTEVKTGVQNNDYIEITEGLYERDTIAVKPVEALYLIELRATKGGGHCH